jgi:hypothetical protein
MWPDSTTFFRRNFHKLLLHVVFCITGCTIVKFCGKSNSLETVNIGRNIQHWKSGEVIWRQTVVIYCDSTRPKSKKVFCSRLYLWN